jgi:hypothetical protein
MKPLLLFFSLLFATDIAAQSFPYKVYDSDGLYHQLISYSLIEGEDRFLVIGNVVDTINNRTETNLFVSSIDFNGNIDAIAIWDNVNYDNEFMFLNSEFHMYNGELILPYFSDDKSCFVSSKLEDIEDIKFIGCDDVNSPMMIRIIGSSLIWHRDSLQFIQTTPDLRSFYLSSISLENEGEVVSYIQTPDLPYRYAAYDIYKKDQDTLFVSGIYVNREPEDRLDHTLGIFVAKIDRNYELVDLALIGEDYVGSSVSVAGHLDEDGYILMACGVNDREDYINTGITKGYTAIVKIDPHTYDIQWETPLDSTVFSDLRSTVIGFADSHQKDGYIYAGRGYGSPEGSISLVYGKISKEGEMLWRKELYDPYQPTSIMARHVIATRDGSYALVGLRIDASEDDGLNTLGQIIMMKFDEEGNILDFTTSTNENSDDETVKILPNPAMDEVLVLTDLLMEKQVSVVNLNGQLVLSADCDGKECRLDTAPLEAGTYLMILTNNKGEMLAKEQLFIHR